MPSDPFNQKCEFMAAAYAIDQIPPEMQQAEIGFVGRSNVGKSSLINALTGRKNLARTSHTPGRTQSLIFFDMGGAFTLVDMPGYGYAKTSKKQRKAWDELIFTYLRGRVQLRAVLLLVDGRRGLKDKDIEMMKLLDEAAVAYRIVLTKIDRQNKGNLANITQDIESRLKNHPAAYPHVAQTSAHDMAGMDDLKAYLADRITG